MKADAYLWSHLPGASGMDGESDLTLFFFLRIYFLFNPHNFTVKMAWARVEMHF